MSALSRLIKLREHLLNLDSGSGEAADLTKALAVLNAAQEWKGGGPSKDQMYRRKLCDALALLTKED